MKWIKGSSWAVAIFLAAVCLSIQAESHRATRLGNPATRFAPPLTTPDDLRVRFLDPNLRPDFISVLEQWGWQGDEKDLFAAAANAEIKDVKIAVGEVMPFMSSRKDGRPVCLRNVTWAGSLPEPAYAFVFASRGQRYRCVTPKACSNFYVEDLGPEAKHGLAIECSVPNTVLVGRKVEASFTVRNTGNVSEAGASVVVPVPKDCTVAEISEGGAATNSTISWPALNVAAGGSHQLRATFKTQNPGVLKLSAVATSADVQPSNSFCETSVMGVSALLLEKADDPDPVSMGDVTTYTVKVTNQGTADDTGVKIVVEFPSELEPTSASNEGVVNGSTVSFPAFARLMPKQAFEYKITAKGVKIGDARVKFIRTSDDIPASTTAEESTRVY